MTSLAAAAQYADQLFGIERGPASLEPLTPPGPPAMRAGWHERSARLIAIALLYAVTSGLVLGAFMQKWSFLEYCSRFGLQEMVEGTAHRPFVYRQAMPYLVKQAEAHVPEAAREMLLTHIDKNRRLTPYALFTPGDQLSDACADQASQAVESPSFRIRHALMYGLAYASIFVALWLMYGICRSIAPRDGWGWVWPILFFLALPYTFRLGGYFYDFSELMFLFALLLLLYRRLALPFVLVLGLAVVNKESALVFPLMIMPLLVARLGWKRGLAVIAVCTAQAMLLIAYTQGRFENNPGEVREFHLLGNLDFWLSLQAFVALGTHSASFIPLPIGANVLVVVALGYAWWRFGRHAPKVYRRTMLLSLLVNVPLFLAFGLEDEVRNLSLSFPVYFVCLYAGWQQHAARP